MESQATAPGTAASLSGPSAGWSCGGLTPLIRHFLATLEACAESAVNSRRILSLPFMPTTHQDHDAQLDEMNH